MKKKPFSFLPTRSGVSVCFQISCGVFIQNEDAHVTDAAIK